MRYTVKNQPIRLISAFLVCFMLLGSAGCKEQTPVIPDPGTVITTPEPAQPLEPPASPSPPDAYIPEGSMISTQEIAQTLREKYADSEVFEYNDSLWDLPKDREFSIDLAFDLINETDYSDFREVYAVYADAELTQPVSTSWEIQTHEDDPAIQEGHSRVYARPGRYSSGRVWGSYYDPLTYTLIGLDEAGDYYLHEQEEYESWGFLKHYYLAQHIDPVTAETLDKPIVTIFTLENQLEAPQSEFYVTKDGKAAFRWNEIRDADYYLIVEINEFSVMHPVDKVTGTKWEHPVKEDSATMNNIFINRSATDDDLINLPGELEDRETSYNNYTVIAVNSTTYSPVGTVHNGEDIAARLPYCLAWNTNLADADGSYTELKFVSSVGLLPTHRSISMTDGKTVLRRMVYDFSFAQIKEDEWLYFDDIDDNGDFINPRIEFHTNLHINYVIEGTIFSETMIVTDVDEKTIMAELEEFRVLLGDTSKRGGGGTQSDIEAKTKKEDSKTSEDAPLQILDKTGERIFANSALSEFLALNILAVNEMIDLSKFPESADWEHLVDAFCEAMYQNPLVLHVTGAYSIPGTNLLMVEYNEPAQKIHEQQNRLREIVPVIIDEIIKPDMTSLEKSFAINNYLIENSEYDWAALRDAERNNFEFVDAGFNDSFTAYGILINRVGVCAGYADAFKLLAEEAGLEAIVVTGFLEGILPHAWNRVKIDGHWHTVDVTNNANEYMLNAFLNLPDSAAGRLLIEDNQFMMSAFIPQYRSNDGSSEFYTVMGLFFDTSEVAAELAREIQQNGSITLRTDYNLDDETFYEIAMEVSELLNTKNLFGFYMLGVIWMSNSL